MYFRRLFYCVISSNRTFSTRVQERINADVEKKDVVHNITDANQYDILSDVITPLCKLDYKEQLIKKQEWCKGVVQKIKSYKIANSKTIIYNILPSPLQEAYRNKDEFSIRTGINGDKKTVGFFVGSPAKGSVICVPPTNLINIKKKHILLAQMFQDFIRQSELKACHDLHDGGFWRNIIIRSNSLGDTMAIVIVNPSGASESEISEVREKLKHCFLSKFPDITSLYLQACPHVRCTSEKAPFDLIHGEPYIFEYIDSLKFRISPDSFFQINSEAATIMYNNIIKLAKPNNKTTFLDLFCGVGTLSLMASNYVRGCIGIESVKQAVEDAEFNAYINSISNCHFTCGLVEKELPVLLNDVKLASNIVAVVNPGRAGIHKNIIKILRKSKIRRLVYVSCKADASSTIKNFVDLSSLDLDKSEPFSLTHVQGVDMFPQTNHCELILIFTK